METKETTIKIGDKVIKAEKRKGIRYVLSKTPSGVKVSVK